MMTASDAKFLGFLAEHSSQIVTELNLLNLDSTPCGVAAAHQIQLLILLTDFKNRRRWVVTFGNSKGV